MNRSASCLGGLAALSLVGSVVCAQVSGSLDVSASDIRYDLFQPSTALALSPTIAYDRLWTSIAARGTLLQFESGHRDLHGSLVGTTFTPAFDHFRLEIGSDLGASRYRSLPTFTHAFGAVDLHYLAPRFGAWLGGSEGNTYFGGTRRGAGRLGVGLWGTIPSMTATLTVAHSAIGDTSFTDVEGTARLNQGRVEFAGRIGDRVSSKGGGHGIYGEATLAFALKGMVNLTLGGGRYPTDPTSGTIAGRYVTLGIRMAMPVPRPSDPYREVLERYLSTPSMDPPVMASVEIDAQRNLRVHAERAAKVEVMGDFTDWEPVLLSSTTNGGWQLMMPIAPGPHMVEIRVDGGAWVAPTGTTPVKDEFGGEAGLIVVP